MSYANTAIHAWCCTTTSAYVPPAELLWASPIEAALKAEEERKARERQHFIDAAVNVVTGIAGAASSASYQHQYYPQLQPRPQHQHQSQPRPQHGERPSGSGKQVHPFDTGYPGRKQDLPSGRRKEPGKGHGGHGPHEKD